MNDHELRESVGEAMGKVVEGKTMERTRRVVQLVNGRNVELANSEGGIGGWGLTNEIPLLEMESVDSLHG